MKIALIDLSHATLGIHTNTVPLGAGLIGRYLLETVDGDLDLRIFKTTGRCLAAVRDWKPDVAGVAQYAWNSELNLRMGRLAKEINPGCLVIAGGPNMHPRPEGKRAYLSAHRFIDIGVRRDGEIPFADSVRRLAAGESVMDIRLSPSAGTYSLDPDSGEFVEPRGPAPRLRSLDVFGSVYADGFFDEFLDDGFHPFVQTQRGCPFSCIYCHAGNRYYDRMISQSADIFRREIEYLGRRYAGQHDITLWMANINFGLLEEDFEIARIIREIQDQYDWPRNIYTSRVHDKERLLDIISIFKYPIRPSISFQTLTPEVLANIRRRNMPLEDFVDFQKKVPREATGYTTSELILSLPGETRENFRYTLSRILNSGVQNIVIHTLMNLRGTPLADRKTSERHGHLIRHRIVPRCFSEIAGVKIFDSEEVVVGTTAMPFDDYLDLRGLALAITAFAGSVEFLPVRKLLLELGGDVASWIFRIQGRMREMPGLRPAYDGFIDDTRSELFSSREELIKFFTRPENYKSLLAGRLGDNLIRKYKALLLSSRYRDCLDLALDGLRGMAPAPNNKRLDAILSDLALYLRSRDTSRIFPEGYGGRAPGEEVLSFDIPRWLAAGCGGPPLGEFKGSFRYRLEVSEYQRNRLRNYALMNRDPGLSLQILYRDGTIQDFWPRWVRS